MTGELMPKWFDEAVAVYLKKKAGALVLDVYNAHRVNSFSPLSPIVSIETMRVRKSSN